MPPESKELYPPQSWSRPKRPSPSKPLKLNPSVDDVASSKNPCPLVQMLNAFARGVKARAGTLCREFDLNLNRSIDRVRLDLRKAFHGTLRFFAA